MYITESQLIHSVSQNLSARNIKGVDTTFVGAINTYEVLGHTKCIIVKDAVAKLEEVYA